MSYFSQRDSWWKSDRCFDSKKTGSFRNYKVKFKTIIVGVWKRIEKNRFCYKLKRNCMVRNV